MFQRFRSNGRSEDEDPTRTKRTESRRRDKERRTGGVWTPAKGIARKARRQPFECLSRASESPAAVCPFQGGRSDPVTEAGEGRARGPDRSSRDAYVHAGVAWVFPCETPLPMMPGHLEHLAVFVIEAGSESSHRIGSLGASIRRADLGVRHDSHRRSSYQASRRPGQN